METQSTKEKTEKELRTEMLHNFGAFEYSVHQMAAILKDDVDSIAMQMKDPKSELYICYHYGKEMREYVIDQKLFDLVQVGDIAAMREFEKRRRR